MGDVSNRVVLAAALMASVRPVRDHSRSCLARPYHLSLNRGGGTMEGLPLPLWLAVAVAASAGSITFVLLKPRRDNWRIAGATLAAGVLTGFVLTFGVCDSIGWKTPNQHMFVAYGLGLLGISLARAAISTVEANAVQLMLHTLRRVLGVQDEGGNSRNDETPPPAKRRRRGGGDADDVNQPGESES